MMTDVLTRSEREVALEICKGLSDKEVAGRLFRSYHTVRTEKKSIYKKLGVQKETELMWWMICERMRINFDLKEIRKHGIELLFCVLFLLMQVSGNAVDMRRCRLQSRTKREYVV